MRRRPAQLQPEAFTQPLQLRADVFAAQLALELLDLFGVRICAQIAQARPIAGTALCRGDRRLNLRLRARWRRGGRLLRIGRNALEQGPYLRLPTGGCE